MTLYLTIKHLWLSYFIEPFNFYSESFISLYNLICVYLIFVAVLICFWMADCIINFSFKKKQPIYDEIKKFFFSGQNRWLRNIFYINLKDRVTPYLDIADVQEFTLLEALWGFLPLFFICTVAYPSLGLEYDLSPEICPTITVKVIASQWNWNVQITSYFTPVLVETNDLDLFFKSPLYLAFIENKNNPEGFLDILENFEYWVGNKDVSVNLSADLFEKQRLLGVSESIVLPINQPIRFIVTSTDVLHSFALPAVALKIDAVPGRLTSQTVIFERPGLIWGQCSELCGPYHGFMPITFEVCDYNSFLNYFFE